MPSALLRPRPPMNMFVHSRRLHLVPETKLHIVVVYTHATAKKKSYEFLIPESAYLTRSAQRWRFSYHSTMLSLPAVNGYDNIQNSFHMRVSLMFPPFLKTLPRKRAELIGHWLTNPRLSFHEERRIGGIVAH